MEAARHISEEARIVLTTLRTGPPDIAHGLLVQNLVNLRLAIKHAGSKKESYVQPFLDVILNPRAAGPHTLIALRSLYRLLSRKSLVLSSEDGGSSAEMTNLMRGILACRFEQTDVGNDEAVEMAIADLLSLIISLDEVRAMDPNIIMEGFNTVFVTRNTFVHSPALCYHFEQVLGAFVRHLFGSIHVGQSAPACRMILEFLVSQLLHTPMNVDGRGINANSLHDATRILSLKLIQSSLRMAWDMVACENDTAGELKIDLVGEDKDPILKIIQDDLCLSILMVGQGIWAYQDPSSSALPGMISTQVLSEICSALSTLWSLPALRCKLKVQFESIFSGFYQRALSLLRRLPVAMDSNTFNANQIFDAEVEIILESLVDILCLHDDGTNKSGLGALETLFVTYDCDLVRSDIASGLIVELSRCCGGSMDEAGHVLPLERVAGMSRMSSSTDTTNAGTPKKPLSRSNVSGSSSFQSILDETELRHVPAHLRELCAEALLGIMKSLFTITSPKIPEEEEKSDNILVVKELENVKHQKRLMREATLLFNTKASSAFDFLLQHGIFNEPVTPKDVATFLRNGIILGLEKPKVGEYLGNSGKSPKAGKSPPDWERDWFHKDTLTEYCASFHFKGQTLPDCLRMFLTSFRLPGEAQQIDRILQAFAESAGSLCVEANQVFSPDPKKAADAAYLLSFSIIMLNTDLHNDNIRADRKMKPEDFIKNNSDYGKDIMDPGYTFPREFLLSIYESIRDEEIRTMGEGADGVMTFERWKDVLRGNESKTADLPLSCTDDMKHLIAEHAWMPILSAIRGFWSVPSEENVRNDYNKSGMLGSQGARLGMDLSMTMLRGLRNLSRLDIFQDLFVRLCFCTGLIGDYINDAVARTATFVESVERQSAVVVSMKIAIECGDLIGLEGWKCVFSILFELRDLKLVGGGGKLMKHRSLLVEGDTDMLQPDARRDWEMQIVKECFEASGGSTRNNISKSRKSGSSFFNSLIFGSPTPASPPRDNNSSSSFDGGPLLKLSDHGKEELVLWDDLAPSDTENDMEASDINSPIVSLGNAFEKLLVQENQSAREGPVTGLETYEDTRVYQLSPRARVRRRLEAICDFSSVLSETRFLGINDLNIQLRALIDVINGSTVKLGHSLVPISLSPASEALAEVFLCEITLKNRDRIAKIWETCLKAHFTTSLRKELDVTSEAAISSIPGVEKRVTGLLRICYHNVHRKDVNNDILDTLDCLYTPNGAVQSISTGILNLNKHISEGLWRICRDVDGLRLIDNQGWDGLLGLIQHCASKGETLAARSGDKSGALSDDDPALQAFRSIHLMLRSNELRDVVPFRIVHCINTMIKGGERNNCPKLSIAGLDLLTLLHARLQALITRSSENKNDEDVIFWANCWLSIVEGMAEASNSRYPVRSAILRILYFAHNCFSLCFSLLRRVQGNILFLCSLTRWSIDTGKIFQSASSADYSIQSVSRWLEIVFQN